MSKRTNHPAGIYLVGDEWALVRSDGAFIPLRDRQTAIIAAATTQAMTLHAAKELIARAEVRPVLNVFDIPTRDDYETTLAANPWVRDFDCFQCDDVVFSQFRAAFSYLSLCRFRRSIDYRRSTYAIKHDCEAVTGTYVSERGCILAALLAGFRSEVQDRCCFLNIASDARANRMIERLRAARRIAA